GEPYEVLSDFDPAPVPAWVQSLAAEKTPRPQGNDSAKVDAGIRHVYLKARAVELVWVGLKDKGLDSALRWLRDQRCERGGRAITDAEIENIADWAETHLSKYPLTQVDFLALRRAAKPDVKSKEDPLVMLAWHGETAHFHNNAEEAFKYLCN